MRFCVKNPFVQGQQGIVGEKQVQVLENKIFIKKYILTIHIYMNSLFFTYVKNDVHVIKYELMDGNYLYFTRKLPK